MRISTVAALGLATLALAGCKKKEQKLVYEAVPVGTRDIVVSVQAAGTVRPDTTVEVKSKASGEVLQLLAETGQVVQQGALLVKIDPRIPRNTLAQAQADLLVARATLQNAKAQKERSDQLYQSQAITQQEHDTAVLDYATAQASVTKAQIAVENAQIALADANVRAPITGTIIEKDVERGQLIVSATGNVSGGTVLLKMADLSLVQVQTLVDETDIGKIQPGQRATVTVDAYPNQPFEGTVIKIEPKADTVQNVTMFPVQVHIANRQGLLRPGMSAEVEIHIGQADSVLAVQNAALRTPRDVGSAALVLGLDPNKVQEQLASEPAPAADSGAGRGSFGASTPGGRPDSAAAKGAVLTLPNGMTVSLPAGVSEAQIKAIMQKRMSGQPVSPDEQALLRKVFQGMRGRGGAGRQGGSGNSFVFGGDYIVFVLRHGAPEPVKIRTGITDLDYSQVKAGLQAGDSVVLLPSQSLIQSQQDFKERINRFMGSPVPGMKSNATSKPSSSSGESRSGGQQRSGGNRSGGGGR